MRSRVVPKQDMQHKYRAEVKSFPYAFVIANHAPGWDNSEIVNTKEDQVKNLVPLSTSKPVVYIEVKARN